MTDRKRKTQAQQKGGDKHEKQSALQLLESDADAQASGDGIADRHPSDGEDRRHASEGNGTARSTLDSVEDHQLAPFITNVKGNVYAITNLPEEFIAVLFAWVSRSSKSFKDHLRQAILEGYIPPTDRPSFGKLDEKAKAFHEKWTVGYGHSSVAEHAVAHVGIEKVSRLASAELELSNEFYSITEYSQRYQRPKRGDWYNPFDTVGRELMYREAFEEFMHECYDVFEKLIDGVKDHLHKQNVVGMMPHHVEAQEQGKKIGLSDLQIEKLAFEDARYALPLAMYTQLGMTANGRAWRDGIVKLYASDYEEVRKLADDLKTEISKVLPTLLKYADPSGYQIRSKQRMKNYFAAPFPSMGVSHTAQLLKFPNEAEAIDNIVAQLYVKHQGLPFREALTRAVSLRNEGVLEIIQDLMFEIGPFDQAPDEFKHLDYQAELLISEANWHQLLRHNRKTNFTFSQPSPYHGITIPPRVKEAGLDHLLIDLAYKSAKLFEKLDESVAPYVVLNAHRRRVLAHFDLWEAYHLINLRTSEEAQWDIRQTFNDLYDQLMHVNPNLIRYAKRR
jgi:thymidylate synthase ThyX